MPLDVLATRWHANLALAFERRGARTVLASRRHEGPLVVQRALYPEGDGTCHAIVVHPPAGIVGGDVLRIDVSMGAGADALLTTPGATKWYRAAARPASQHVRLEVAAGASLEWLPQESIVFDGALSHQHVEAHLAADAVLVAWDVQCLGRTGSGETFRDGALHLHTRIIRDGRLAWLERARIEGDKAALHAIAGLAGHTVFGTLVLAAPRIDPAWVALARAVVPEEGDAAVTALPGVLLARYRGDSSEAGRHYGAAVWSQLRAPALGRAAMVPRIWRT